MTQVRIQNVTGQNESRGLRVQEEREGQFHVDEMLITKSNEEWERGEKEEAPLV